MKKIHFFQFLFVLSLTLNIGCGGGGQMLTVADIQPGLAPLGGNSIVFPGIEYSTIGDATFDDFFLKSAKINGLITLANVYIDSTMASLKRTAQDAASSDALKEDVKLLIGDKPKDQLTDDELIAITKMAIKKNKVSTDVTKGYIESGANMVILGYSLVKAATEVPSLISTGKDLAGKATSLSPLKVPSATKGVSGALSNLGSAISNLPTLASNLTKLGSAMKQFSEN